MGGGGTDGRQGEADLSANDKMTPAITEFTAQLYPYEILSRKEGGNDAIYTQTELSTFYLFNICGMSKKTKQKIEGIKLYLVTDQCLMMSVDLINLRFQAKRGENSR